MSAVPQTLTTLLQALDATFRDVVLNPITLRADKNNSGQVRVLKGSTDVAANRVGYLEAREALAFDLITMGIHSDSLWLVGTANDTVWVSCVIL